MPLVTLTCSEKWFPRERQDENGWCPPLSAKSKMIVELAKELPDLMVKHADELRLEPTTPREAVQVDIRRFHAYAQNSVGIWVHVQLTEEIAHRAARIPVRDTLTKILHGWFDENQVETSWALDIFFGPGHGCFTDVEGKIIQRW